MNRVIKVLIVIGAGLLYGYPLTIMSVFYLPVFDLWLMLSVSTLVFIIYGVSLYRIDKSMELKRQAGVEIV